MRDLAPPGTRLLLASSFLSTVPTAGLVTSLIVACSGVLADRWGRRRFLLAGTLLPVPSYLVFATTTEAAWLIATAVGAGFAVWGFTNALGPIASGALLGAGIFVLPLVIGSTMYFLGGLAFGIGFTRLLASQENAGASAVASLGGDADP